MSSILVTGGAGAIGSTLVNRLLGEGHKVTVLDDFSSGLKININQSARLIRGSVVDENDLLKAFENRPTYVFHLAALFANQNSVDHPDRDLQTNGLGTIRILENCVRHNVKKVLFTSSSCVYGNSEVMRETDLDLHLDTPYAITKLLGEHYCSFWSEQYGLDSVVTRLFNTYGPGELPGPYRNVIPNFLQLAGQGKPLPITGTGEETRDFTYVEDTVSGLMAAMFSKTSPGAVYNISLSSPRKIIDMATMINDITGNSGGIEFRPARSWDSVRHRCGANEKAVSELSFNPQIHLEEGLVRTWEWLKGRL